MNKLSFSLLLALLPTAFSTNAAAQNQVFEIVNTANTYEKVNFFQGDFARVGTSIRYGIIDKEGREIIPCHLYTSSISSLSLYNTNIALVLFVYVVTLSPFVVTLPASSFIGL